jgi:hypothetical protein
MRHVVFLQKTQSITNTFYQERISIENTVRLDMRHIVFAQMQMGARGEIDRETIDRDRWEPEGT